MARSSWGAGLSGVVLLTAVALPLSGQWDAAISGRATALMTRADPTPYGPALTEVRLTQPVLSLRANYRHRLSVHAALNGEALTLPDGELSAGAWGEGFVDRRHPHTFFHELMVDAVASFGPERWQGRLGLAVGKGFAPFGTDDPMNRPFSTFPVNHHLSQVLERAVAIGQVGIGPAVLDVGVFNGDEPESPWQWPLLHQSSGWRFGDSWSARLLVTPIQGLEVQLSTAKVHSPEHRPGAGGDQQKRSGSLRWIGARPDAGQRLYAMLEIARTSELEESFVFHSLLAETALDAMGGRLAYRFERTDRPEEERIADPFHTRRPHLENAILGTFVWTLHTVRIERQFALDAKRLRLTPFLEGTLGSISLKHGVVVSPEGIYGTNVVRHLRAGITLTWSDNDHRMGRYGLLALHQEGGHH